MTCDMETLGWFGAVEPDDFEAVFSVMCWVENSKSDMRCKLQWIVNGPERIDKVAV